MKRLFVVCMTVILVLSNSYFAFSAERDIPTQPIQVQWDETFSSITDLDYYDIVTLRDLYGNLW